MWQGTGSLNQRGTEREAGAIGNILSDLLDGTSEKSRGIEINSEMTSLAEWGGIHHQRRRKHRRKRGRLRGKVNKGMQVIKNIHQRSRCGSAGYKPDAYPRGCRFNPWPCSGG